MVAVKAVLVVLGVAAGLCGTSQGLRVAFRRSPLMHNSWDPWQRSLWHQHNPLFDPFWSSDFDELIEWHSPFLRSSRESSELARGNPVHSQCGCQYHTQPHSQPENGVNCLENLCSNDCQKALKNKQSRNINQNLEEAKYKRQRTTPHTAMPTTNLHQHPVTFAELDVSGYQSNELDIWTEGNKVVIKGHRKCDCDDSCLVREFQRSYGIPQNLDSRSVRAKYGRNGMLVLQGNVARNRQQIQQNRQVEIDYQGPKETPRKDIQCPQKKAGITLKKVKVPSRDLRKNKVVHSKERVDKTFEGEIGDDGVTIEVVE